MTFLTSPCAAALDARTTGEGARATSSDPAACVTVPVPRRAPAWPERNLYACPDKAKSKGLKVG
jgi:hypothetical protein